MVVHGGKWSVRLERNAQSAQEFSTILGAVPIRFTGSRIEMRGYLRTEHVSGFSGIWMREDGDQPNLAFDNMQNAGLKGTTEWKQYTISLAVHPDARRLYFGVLMAGSGRTWADDLQILVDGKPVWEAPPRPETATALSRDHEFDSGSKVAFERLTPLQSRNLALLGRVWGYLKYHHPRVTAGQLHWDYELFRVLPAIVRAEDQTTAQRELREWITRLGPVEPCTKCASLKEGDLHLPPQIGWLSDAQLLGSQLSEALRSVHRNRQSSGKQFYVSLAPGVGNPSFNNEPAYPQIQLPDPGYQLLALFRFWNIIEYWFPYRNITGERSDELLAEFVPRIALAKDGDAYQLEMTALIARVHDGHANLWSSLNVRPPRGACQVPVKLRFVGGEPVVTSYVEGMSGLLRPGDVVERLDGSAVATLVERWAPFYAASNDTARLDQMARTMTRGACADASMRIRRSGEVLEIKAPRVPQASVKTTYWHDMPGETFRKLSEDVAYLKLSTIKADMAASYIEQAAGTKGLIIDIRNYPAGFSVFTLGSLLVDAPTEFARFTYGDLTNPGAFHWTEPITLKPSRPHYGGKVVILVDEVSMSSAEYTAMAFRASPRATVIGSTTAGADGNVSQIPLPGGLRSMISGIGVFYPDKRPTQRIGIVPDLEARPTVEGIQSGRDEVLERAIRTVVGDDLPAEAVEKMARH